MNNIPLVDLKKQYKEIKKDLFRVTNKILSQGNFILGDEVEEFEKAFASFCGTKYCVGVASGTDALLLAYRSLGIGPGDEVVTQANTFIATVFPILALGAKPVLVDINPQTYQIDTKLLEKAISRKTKLIVPVHLYGIPAPMDKIMRIAKKNKLWVVEDACQAHGSAFKRKKCGSFGDLAAFSFYPGKNLGAAGDGGAVVTDSLDLTNKIKIMRNVGQSEKYKHPLFGYNSRLDTLQAAILSIKLKKIEIWNKQRKQIARKYKSLLGGLPVQLPPVMGSEYLENYHLYVIRTTERDRLLNYLKSRGIFCGIHYPLPLHLQESLWTLGYKRGDFPITEKYAEEIISLPIYPGLTTKELNFICKEIRKFINKELSSKKL